MVCAVCKDEKSTELFRRDSYAKGGRRTLCSECSRKQLRKHYAEAPQRILTEEEHQAKLEYRRQYKMFKAGQLPDFVLKREASRKTPEQILDDRKAYRLKYYSQNRERYQRYHEKSKHKTRISKKRRHKERLETDLNYKLRIKLKDRINKSVKGILSQTLLALLGCDFAFFRHWIERNFARDMSWDNFGFGMNKWNIDHEVPLCAFDLTNPEQQRLAFHWSNMFPVWQKENLAKGGKIRAAIDYQI